ncbi:MAG: hypothetical protein LBT46_04195 [Planctomycetaceae bacterium]|jgi:hypothetical protein|nr:hypothetical protein [Planctomycetaceae bacterium]
MANSICSFCNTPIESGSTKTVCPECKLEFHEECWQHNKGCSAYGCKYVNYLNPPLIVGVPLNNGSAIYGGVDYGQPSINPVLSKIKFSFRGWWITFIILEVLSFFVGVAVSEEPDADNAILGYSIIFSIPWVIFGCMLFYRLWSITDESVRDNTSAGNATASFFIPIYYIYWFPTGYYRLADKINKTLALRGNPYCIAMATLGGWAGGLWILKSFMMRVPDLQVLASLIEIVCFILLILYYHSCIKAAERILTLSPRYIK